MCTTYDVYNFIARSCTGVGSEQHWPGQECQNDGGPGAPGWEVIVTIGIECGDGNSGGRGEGGGASYPPNNTTPTPPEDYEPCSAFSDSGEEFLIPCSGDGNSGQPLTAAQQLIIQLEIADVHQMNLVNSDAMLVLQLQSYLNVSSNSIDSENFARWAVAYLTVNTDITFSEIEQMNSIPNSTITLPNIIDVTHLSDYPAFKSMVENLPTFLTQNPEVLNSLSRYTGFSKAKIMQLMQPGKGPKVELVSNLSDTNGNELLGHYDRANKILQIRKELIVGLDKVQSPKRYKALGMLLAITTLHEFVHYGRDINKLSIRLLMNGISYEPGLLFELSISPPYNYNYISRNNAIEWANFYKFNIND